jgi:ADP-ribose pyrophosphatase YjhB (NUDIX family)
MNTLQGAGGIVVQPDRTVLLVRVKRRGMNRWELPSAIRKSGESLLGTVYRCVEEESGFRLTCRIGRPVCFGINSSEQLKHSYFAIFFECAAESVTTRPREVPDVHADLPAAAKQSIIESRFVDWRKLPSDDLHPQHRDILEQWVSNPGGSIFSVVSDADREMDLYLATHSAVSGST